MSLAVLRSRWRGNEVDSAVRHPYITARTLTTLLKKRDQRTTFGISPAARCVYSRASFLLLGFIVYGTTVEAAHSHGNLVESTDAAQATSVSDPVTATKLNALYWAAATVSSASYISISPHSRSFPANNPAALPKGEFADLTTISFSSQIETPALAALRPSTLL